MGSRGEYGAAAFGRCVGTSPLAFWADCGQPRKLLRSSSGAKSRGVSQLPASIPITSSPACVSGSAATPPTAPRPTITTSVFLRLVAMTAALDREHSVVVSRFPDGCRLNLHALLVIADGHVHCARKSPAPDVPLTKGLVPSIIKASHSRHFLCLYVHRLFHHCTND